MRIWVGSLLKIGWLTVTIKECKTVDPQEQAPVKVIVPLSLFQLYRQIELVKD